MDQCYQCKKKLKDTEETNYVGNWKFCMECFEAIITGRESLREEDS